MWSWLVVRVSPLAAPKASVKEVLICSGQATLQISHPLIALHQAPPRASRKPLGRERKWGAAGGFLTLFVQPGMTY